jgi:hypothetical protein
MVAMAASCGKRRLVAAASRAYLGPFPRTRGCSMSSHGAASEANRLYWETELSVAEIAQQLELSRRALYDAVQPMTVADLLCEICGGPVVYENRSARTASRAVCLRCRDREESGPDETDEPSDAEAHGRDHRIDARTVRVGGAMLAGAMIGAAAALLVVRRD